MAGHGQFTPVYKSQVIKNNLSPTWDLFSIKVRDLCNGDYDRQLKVDIYDWDQKGAHDLIGSFTTTLNGMKAAIGQSK